MSAPADIRLAQRQLQALLKLRRLRAGQATDVLRRRREELIARERSLETEMLKQSALQGERDAQNAQRATQHSVSLDLLQSRVARVQLLSERIVQQQQRVEQARLACDEAQQQLDASRALWRRACARCDAIELQIKRIAQTQSRARLDAQEQASEDLAMPRYAAGARSP